AHVVEGFERRPAEADLVEDLGELVGQGVAELLDQAADGGIESKPGFDRDGQQVEGIGERQPKLTLAALDLVVEKDVREIAAEREPDCGASQVDWQAEVAQNAHQEVDEQGNHEPEDELGNLESVDAKAVGPAGQVDLVLEHDLTVLRHARGEQAADTLQRRLNEAFAEGQGELDLIQGQVVIAVPGKALRDQVLARLGSHRLHGDDDSAEG